MNAQDRQTLTEILAYALDVGDDDIAEDCRLALRGDREAFGYVRLDVDTRADYAQWRAA